MRHTALSHLSDEELVRHAMHDPLTVTEIELAHRFGKAIEEIELRDNQIAHLEEQVAYLDEQVAHLEEQF